MNELATHPLADAMLMNRQSFQAANGIIGNSIEIREIVDTVIQVAPTDITVLLTGESGTGKEIIAHAIHAGSKRSGGKFMPVNCGAIPEGILESELFGHEKGSFTGAVDTRKGYFEIADGGTIFLDEIGEMPLTTQVKLLRVLENGEFLRVGSSEPRTSDVRIIAATNKDLDLEVRNKRFREDLFYRLRSVNIRIPALRHRRSDIALLTAAFLSGINEKNGNGSSILITDDGMTELMRYSWPGNIRELRNFIESVAILEHGKVLDQTMVLKYLHREETRQDDRPLPVVTGRTSEQAERELIFRALLEIRTELTDLRSLIENAMRAPLSLPPAETPSEDLAALDSFTFGEMERTMIERALKRFDGNRRLAAHALGLSERTLYRKINEYNIQ
jgi:transcriptional regulator with PAS, ATPase and Fis domain